jgi:hypothetical protein
LIDASAFCPILGSGLIDLEIFEVEKIIDDWGVLNSQAKLM